jgi:hypothetical protein
MYNHYLSFDQMVNDHLYRYVKNYNNFNMNPTLLNIKQSKFQLDKKQNVFDKKTTIEIEITMI